MTNMSPSKKMVDFCWHSWQLFFRHRKQIHYDELIIHWILEGLFGHIDHVDKAYMKGHQILMELLDCELLKTLGSDLICMEELAPPLTDRRKVRYGETSSLGLATTFDDGNWKGFGRIDWTDGIVKTLSEPKGGKISTLLLDGSRLSKENPENFFQSMQDLQTLALFKPRFVSLPSSLLTMEKLLILALRGSDLLEDVDEIRKLKSLLVLDMSGASSLKLIPDNVFKHVSCLRSLNLSSLPIKNLPSSVDHLSELRWLILRNCPCLEGLPHLKTFKNLERLDASGATQLKEILDKSFAPLRKLQYLNLSHTQVVRLPFICKAVSLTQLFLSGCSCLFRLPSLPTSLQTLNLSKAGETEIQGLEDTIKHLGANVTDLQHLNLSCCLDLYTLPPTKAFAKLKSLDLSGAVNLGTIKDESFGHLTNLEILNLSNTKVVTLPSLSKLSNLRQLVFKDCDLLENLPEMEELVRLEKLYLSGCSKLEKMPLLSAAEKLEILDLSGCVLVKGIDEESFQNMPQLQLLNLSKTMIKSLPSMDNLGNLQHLILRDCALLESLAGVEHLTKLQELDLRGATAISLEKVNIEFLECMVQLQILDLSGTPVTKLPALSKLINLTRLSLSGCQYFEEMPPLDHVTKLEDLDLTGTKLRYLASVKTLGSLRRLSLKNCTSLELLPLEPQNCLECLDLSGLNVKEFPYWVCDLTNLKCLHLPDLKDIKQVDWGKIRHLPQQVNWEECSIFKLAGHVSDYNKPFISINGTDFFPFLDRNPALWNTCFKQFHFCVYPRREQGQGGDICHYRNELAFREIYNKIRYVPEPEPEEQGCSLEVYGFKGFPEGLGSAIKRAGYVSLTDVSCMSCISDLGDDRLEALKGCWLEKCDDIQSVFKGKEKSSKLGADLKILWVSNIPNIGSIYSKEVQPVNYQNLRELYIDSCPKLVNVFTSGQIPENLAVLQVKYCDKLETLFENEEGTECELPNLHTLHLLELPMLKRIGIRLSPHNKHEVTYDVTECPNLPREEMESL